MRARIAMACTLCSLFAILLSNSFLVLRLAPWLLLGALPLLGAVWLVGGLFALPTRSFRRRVICHGMVLLCAFCVGVPWAVSYHLVLALVLLPTGGVATWLWSAATAAVVLGLLFWQGIVCVYCTSLQLGVRQRVIGVLCFPIPLVNVVVLLGIIRTTWREICFETEKERCNAARRAQKVCATRYPIVLVHGIFFRDFKYVNYWGRIPDELRRNGAQIFYGGHQSAASIHDCAVELDGRIRAIVAQLGCEKVNIIAHSKGGLDCRYAMAHLGTDAYVASLTTINTPHRGCGFADALLTRIPQGVQQRVARTYDRTLKRLGDPSPDFMAAVRELTAAHCEPLDAAMPCPPGVYCQSVGSILPHIVGGKFPMNVAYPLVKYYDGPNDGLVRESSFRWGQAYQLLRPTGLRGISHGDMIDLNRENIAGFDVREFYVQLVQGLKARGL